MYSIPLLFTLLFCTECHFHIFLNFINRKRSENPSIVDIMNNLTHTTLCPGIIIPVEFIYRSFYDLTTTSILLF